MFPDGSKEVAKNFCRNPTLSTRDGVWCYTMDTQVEWEYCNICPDRYQGYNGCSMPNKGYRYIGKLAHTLSFQECDLWVKHPNSNFRFTEGGPMEAKNYCRNPAPLTYEAPWCYIEEASNVTWEYCDICKPFQGHVTRHQGKREKSSFGVRISPINPLACLRWCLNMETCLGIDVEQKLMDCWIITKRKVELAKDDNFDHYRVERVCNPKAGGKDFYLIDCPEVVIANPDFKTIGSEMECERDCSQHESCVDFSRNKSNDLCLFENNIYGQTNVTGSDILSRFILRCVPSLKPTKDVEEHEAGESSEKTTEQTTEATSETPTEITTEKSIEITTEKPAENPAEETSPATQIPFISAADTAVNGSANETTTKQMDENGKSRMIIVVIVIVLMIVIAVGVCAYYAYFKLGGTSKDKDKGKATAANTNKTERKDKEKGNAKDQSKGKGKSKSKLKLNSKIKSKAGLKAGKQGELQKLVPVKQLPGVKQSKVSTVNKSAAKPKLAPTSTRAPTGISPQAPTQASMKTPTKTQTQTPTKTQTQTPTKTQTQTPTKTQTQAPTQAPAQAPTKTQTQAPTKTQTQAPTKTQTQAPTKTPVQTPAPSPAAPTQAQTQTPVWTQRLGKTVQAPSPTPLLTSKGNEMLRSKREI